MTGKNYRDLIAWQKAMDLVEQVYRVTARFPDDERYGLRSQLRRCSVSIPSNIAEGQGRFSDGEFRNQLSSAHGSVREAETQILLGGRLGYIDKQGVEEMLDQAAEVGRLVGGLANSLRSEQ